MTVLVGIADFDLATINQFEPGSRKRGTRYALEGRVTDVEVTSGLILGRVQGSDIYDVEWTELPRGWKCLCSCPVHVDCKHAFAVDSHDTPDFSQNIGGVPLGLAIAEDMFQFGGGKAPKHSV